MSGPAERERVQIFESLRRGVVPEVGLEHFATGVESDRAELGRQLDLVSTGQGSIKFLRGGYGCGKTFMARLAMQDALARGMVASFVVVSDNDLRFHKFDELYRKVMAELSTASCPRGAFADILDRWVSRVEEALLASGADDDAPDFDAKVRDRIEVELRAATRGEAPQEFIQGVQTVFDLQQEGRMAEAGGLVAWLSGSSNISSKVKRLAGVKGDLKSRDAMAYLRGVVAIARAAGHPGVLIVVDEAETILRSRRDVRRASLNGLRQIDDAAGSYPGLLWLFTGTPEFFDSRQGVAGLAPLHDRIKFIEQGGFASRKQPQLVLRPFDRERLLTVARRLTEIFPAKHPERIEQKVSDAFLQRMAADVSSGFGEDVGVVPRQFLRELMIVLDLVEQEEDYEPATHYAFHAPEVLPEGAAVQSTATDESLDTGELLTPAEDVW